MVLLGGKGSIIGGEEEIQRLAHPPQHIAQRRTTTGQQHHFRRRAIRCLDGSQRRSWIRDGGRFHHLPAILFTLQDPRFRQHPQQTCQQGVIGGNHPRFLRDLISPPFRARLEGETGFGKGGHHIVNTQVIERGKQSLSGIRLFS